MVNTHNQIRTGNTWVRFLSKLLVFTTLFLIFAGALVKSHEVGLSVPDWPTSYGYQMFFFPFSDMVGGIFYEHGHRLIATIVGMLTVVLAISLYISDDRLWMKKIGFTALGFIIIQGIFGGLTVLFFLPTPVSVIHAVLAQTFLIIIIFIAYGLSNERGIRIKAELTEGDDTLKNPVFLVTGLVFLQLTIGALMRHTQSGLAITDFPLAGGYFFPPFNQAMLNTLQNIQFESGLPLATMNQVLIHFLHRIMAVAVGCAVGWLSLKVFKKYKNNTKVFWNTFALDVTILIQIVLGAFTIWSVKEPLITSFHVVNGAVILGLSMLMVLRVSPARLQGNY